MMKNLKKIELHLHLDGSINIDYAKKMINSNVEKELKANDKCTNLKEYLEKFTLPLSLLQTKENLEKFSNLLIEDLTKDNVIYAEIRFCPYLHTKEGLTMEEVIESVLKGLRNDKNIKTNLIICMMRNLSEKTNIEIINVTEKYLNKGVAALDLAGDEASYDNEKFSKLFEIAREKQIPFTIHSGEAGSYKNVLSAIKYGAKRIGHGIKSIENQKVIEEIIKNNITLELCPTSNVQTNAIDKYENHPIKELIDKKVLVTVNTDNRTVSNITLQKEYEKLSNYFNFTPEDFKKMNINAVKAAFLTEEEKQKLIYIIENDN